MISKMRWDQVFKLMVKAQINWARGETQGEAWGIRCVITHILFMSYLGVRDATEVLADTWFFGSQNIEKLKALVYVISWV